LLQIERGWRTASLNSNQTAQRRFNDVMISPTLYRAQRQKMRAIIEVGSASPSWDSTVPHTRRQRHGQGTIAKAIHMPSESQGKPFVV